MAQRRMFSPDITESDSFGEMTSSAQALYFRLGMRADDDGFVNPKMVMRTLGSSGDDLHMLVLRRFVLPFENGVVVIKHWRINNFVRKDRYKETLYLDEKSNLRVKENGIYTLDTSQGLPISEVPWKSDDDKRKELGQPFVNLWSTQVRLGKVRLGKDTNTHHVSEEYSKEYLSFWEVFPKKVGKGDAWKAWKKAKLPNTEVILASVKEHASSDQWQREGGRFIPNPATWLNQRRWEDEVPKNKSSQIKSYG